jgi:hypothetical protein
MCQEKFLLYVLSGLAALPSLARASEGGGSHYVQGTQGDFAMALTGPAGLYLRDDLTYMEGSIGPVTRGRYTLSSYDQEVWVNTTKLIYMSDVDVLGGRFGAVLGIPYVIDVTARGTVVAPVPFEASGNSSGFSDPSLTAFVNWKVGDTKHVTTGMTVYSDLGSYDVNRIINLGRNYWSLDTIASFTWLDPKTGHEFSITGGFLFNTTNPDTDYQTGTEFHTDVALAQHFPGNIAVGLIGYYYNQLSDDTGALLGTLPVGSGGFQGSSVGLGLAFSVGAKVGGQALTFTGKFLQDLDNTNRFDTDLYMISCALKF